MYLHRFAISKKVQSKGIGAWCLTHMEELVRRRGRRWIRLDATLVDPKVRAFYERAGFQAEASPIYQCRFPITSRSR